MVLTGTEVATGDRVMPVKFVPALVIFKVALPCMDPNCAVTVTTPTTTPVANPALLTEATLVSEELQSTELVRSFELPSEYLPVAVNC